MSKPGTIILWVHPRSTSTMFECAALQKQEELRVLHEPLGDSFYFNPEEKISNRYSLKQCKEDYPQYKDSTFAKVWNDIVTPPSIGPQRTFSKDMAFYIFPLNSNDKNEEKRFPPSFSSSNLPTESLNSNTNYYPTPPQSIHNPSQLENPTLIPKELLLDSNIIHTFLIRNPKKSIPSFDKLCYPGCITGFDYFDPEEIGIKQLRKLYDFLKFETGKELLVMDSEDLLKNPQEVMKMWCDEVGIEFDESMLSWKEGEREHFKKWTGWHSSAENSTGFGQGKEIKSKDTTKEEEPKLSKEILNYIDENMEDYLYLKSFVRVVGE